MPVDVRTLACLTVEAGRTTQTNADQVGLPQIGTSWSLCLSLLVGFIPIFGAVLGQAEGDMAEFG